MLDHRMCNPFKRCPSEEREQNPYDKIMLLGDSITEFAEDQSPGFALAPAVRSAYIRRLDVVNRGFAGYNTAMILKHLPKFIRPVDEGRIQILTIWLGANDSVRPGLPGHQSLPLPTYTSNLRAIAHHVCIAVHAPRIILLTPPPVDEHQRFPLEGAQLWRRAHVTRAYADACKHAAREMNVPVLDVWGLFMREAGWVEGGEELPGSLGAPRSEVLGRLLVDGIHLTPEGYKIVYDGLMQLIRNMWPDLCPEALPYVCPAWDDEDAWEAGAKKSRAKESETKHVVRIREVGSREGRCDVM